jgi:hypothetical protein
MRFGIQQQQSKVKQQWVYLMEEEQQEESRQIFWYHLLLTAADPIAAQGMLPLQEHRPSSSYTTPLLACRKASSC